MANNGSHTVAMSSRRRGEERQIDAVRVPHEVLFNTTIQYMPHSSPVKCRHIYLNMRVQAVALLGENL